MLYAIYHDITIRGASQGRCGLFTRLSSLMLSAYAVALRICMSGVGTDVWIFQKKQTFGLLIDANALSVS